METTDGTLAPPAVTALRGAGQAMERTLSGDMRLERQDLREAAEQTLNVILDLGLDGVVRWVSPSWTDVIGTGVEGVQGRSIGEVVEAGEEVFGKAVEGMRGDAMRSQIVRFELELGEASKLLRVREDGEGEEEAEEVREMVDLEGQGIMVYDRSTGEESHTMWMIRPWVEPRELKIDLPSIIVESLGSGAEVLASHLNMLAEAGLDDPAHHAPPPPVLCRICERQIPPWWFEKHTELCLQEHQAEMKVQICQENLTEHRHAIVKVLDALEARKSRPLSTTEMPLSSPHAEYKGMPIGPTSQPSSASGSSSPAPNRPSRDPSASKSNHTRARSFAVRRPQARIVELLLDLCDTAIEIGTPAIKEVSSQIGEFRTQSPASESRVSQVLQWQSPSTNTLDQEQGLALLCADSEKAAKEKVDAVLRHRGILEYSERIRGEFALIVQDCIDEAVRKAARFAAGLDTDSMDEDDDVPEHDDSFFRGSFDGPSTLAAALREAETKLHEERQSRSSKAVSTTGSSSPKECPTPRSHAGTLSMLTQARHSSRASAGPSRRGSLYFESGNDDSDSSIRSSSVMSRPARIESPVSEFGDLRRAASSRQRDRRSMVLPGHRSSSPQRQESPSRPGGGISSSPLRIVKPRSLATGQQAVRSPVTSPLLSYHEFASPSLAPHHHRRQSSATGSVPPPSPRLNSASVPQARAVPPSIKDFEIIKPISKGAFGSVYLSKKKSTGDYFAIKVLKKADMVAKNQVTNVKAERAIMMWQGESDFVAKLYWTFSSKDYLYLVMEYLNGGDCASLIKVLGGLPEDWAKKYLGEVILGVEHLHSRGIVHRDLKPDNLLIDQKGHLKLTDFGLSRMGLIGRQKRVLSSAGSEQAPDLLKQGPFARASSLASSRSTSFDFQSHQSPGSTPMMTPDLGTAMGQPSYFSLTRENSMSRDSRQSRRSDSGGSDTLSAMFSSFSLNEPQQASPRPREGEENESERGSPEMFSLQNVNSHSSVDTKNTPPQASMMPPPMALFDPDDNTRRFVGTPDYLAPETVKGEGQDETSDWWSVGCILFELLYGYPPFHGDTPEHVFENILARKISWPSEDEAEVSQEAKDLMNALLCMSPAERLGANTDEKFSSGAEEIRNHPWFADINWDTLLQDEAQFVPVPENLEDTEYFDSRGATLQSFAEEMEDQISPAAATAPPEYPPERPHDALSRVRTQINSMKRGLMPLHIPPHVRDLKSRRLSEPVVADDFGNFAFKNLPVLEKANKDVIQKLRAEAIAAQSKAPVSPVSTGNSAMVSPLPALEGSPVIPMSLQRTMSNAKAGNRPASPSLSQANSSPSRQSQPSSPLLVSFVAGQQRDGGEGNGRRKTSSTSSSLSQQQSLQPGGGFFDVPRISPTLHKSGSATVSTSPIKTRGIPAPLALSPAKVGGPHSTPGRSRSQTVGSQESSPITVGDIFSHHKRRSQVFDMSPSSSDNEGDKANALLRVQRRRQSSRRLSQINISDGPVFRPLDVLICEDHPVSRMVMEKLLEKLRCRTITVADGAEATRVAMSDIKFDIIMMEFKLPAVNGADVARMIRSTKTANSTTPIVAITGYLKELQQPHFFDALVEKPPTTSKLTDVLCRLCHWKAPAPGQAVPLHYPMPSGLRQESLRLDDSPSSGSSARLAGSSFRGSSRGDSIGSSLFGDESSSVAADDVAVIISRKATGEWDVDSGLGISEDGSLPHSHEIPKLLPHLSAPASLETQEPPGTPCPAPASLSSTSPILKRPLSPARLRAKRDAIRGSGSAQHAESGDDEDEELGDTSVKERSPKGKTGAGHRGSKLGTEMMRTNSRGSVVSGFDVPGALDGGGGGRGEDDLVGGVEKMALTPPAEEGGGDMDETPRPRSLLGTPGGEEETPRAGKRGGGGYLSAGDAEGR
ncbi:AGC protein kinase [Pseudogymnoascus sp. WSF 3629]|nr:AGC protein kinase [Pseudogymnoascus sp. WSF 3629]